MLVVDDSRDAADSLALLATIWGYNARPAYDGATAFYQAVARPPDVVLMDIGMPRMDGLRLAALMRRHPLLADTLLVAVTGYADEPHRRLSAGLFDHYLVKPVEPTTVGRLLLAEQVRRAAATAAVDPPLPHTARAPAGRRTRRPLPSEVISVE